MPQHNQPDQQPSLQAGDPPPGQESLSYLQKLHRQRSQRLPSVTMQVTTNAPRDRLDPVEQSFLVTVDRVLRQTVLPPTVSMGCDRLPIALYREQ